MKNFVVVDLVDGWSGQATSLKHAISIRDEIVESYPPGEAEVVIRADVDESDL